MFNMVYRGGRIRGGEGNASIWWKDLNVVREGRGVSEGRWIDDNINRLVGSGERVLFWNNWLGGGTLENRFHRLFGLDV
jgi:hypothetical protein